MGRNARNTLDVFLFLVHIHVLARLSRPRICNPATSIHECSIIILAIDLMQIHNDLVDVT